MRFSAVLAVPLLFTGAIATPDSVDALSARSDPPSVIADPLSVRAEPVPFSVILEALSARKSFPLSSLLDAFSVRSDALSVRSDPPSVRSDPPSARPDSLEIRSDVLRVRSNDVVANADKICMFGKCRQTSKTKNSGGPKCNADRKRK